MSDIVIQVEGLGKKYLLRHLEQSRQQDAYRYRTLRDALAETALWLFKHRTSNIEYRTSDEEFWALQDVSFEIKQGERLGIIGGNGAGKSTLLKILSRITEPTQGRVRIKGRVASLLEVGTGFHPELTGRENIFLNGAILGMTQAEIRQKFDEIVAFAEVEKFLDTPVKRYSSGMYVRLAFAVAAHLEPDILIVDEVLAVGDAAFQSKCLGKMQDVADKEGRTVLFVSHNMNAIQQLCGSALMLRAGSLTAHSRDVRQVVRDYLSAGDGEVSDNEWRNAGSQFENPWFTPLSFRLANVDGYTITQPVSNAEAAWVEITGAVRQLDPALTIGYAIYSRDGTLLYWSYQTDDAESRWPRLQLGRVVLRSQVPQRFLNEGDYRLELMGSLHGQEWLFKPGDAVPTIRLSVRGGLSDSPHWMSVRPGLLAPVIPWQSEP